jgi:hypothetical protein
MRENAKNMLRISPGGFLKPAVLCVFFFFAAYGCALKNTESVQALDAAGESVLSRFESGSCYGLEAAISLDKASGEWRNIILNAIYTMPVRIEGENSAKFALFFPNGGKIGQCERILEDTECSGLSFPGAETLIRNAFAAVDGLAQRRYGADRGTFTFGKNAPGYSFKAARGAMSFHVLITRYLTKQ